jgi:hypothetical protein
MVSFAVRAMTSIPERSADGRDSAVAEDVKRLRAAIETRSATSPLADLRPTIEALGASARANDVPPEMLLVQVKDMLRTIPRPNTVAEDQLRERVISHVIDAYYVHPESGDGARA